MKLKSGLTLWTKRNRPPPDYPALRKDVVCDVAVIGAGITGALIAHELVARGQQVVVLDKRAAGTASTSASTALLLYETDSSLAELTRRHGWAAAARTYALGRRAIRELGAIARSFASDCGFRPAKSLYVASDRHDVAQLRREAALRRRAKLPARWLTRGELRAEFGLDFPAALYSGGAAQIDAMRLAQRLFAHHLRHRRLRLFQHTRVTGLEPGATQVRVRTASGAHVTARHVVVATGYEAAPFLADDRVRLHSSYVVASRPVPPRQLWRDRCLIWETARPYFYLRTTDDNRVLIGGEDEPFADPRRRDAKLPAKARALGKRFRELFPQIKFRQEFAWTGTFVESPDGLPYIGPKEPGSRVFYALGYGGNGITFSQVAARILGKLCGGRTSRDARMFRFAR